MTGMSLLVPGLFSANIKEGMFFTIKNGILCNSDSKPIITIDNKNRWSGVPNSYKTDPFRRENELKIIKNSIETEESFLTLVIGNNRTAFQIKAKEKVENSINQNNVLTGLQNLIGLGQGLTPSGDDFITGALLAQSCFNGSIKIERESIKQHLNRTTYAGRTLLYQALEGSFPYYLLTFIKEISKDQTSREYINTLKKACNHGSTSGRDAIAGFYWYHTL